jgi:hypothetical protein
MMRRLIAASCIVALSVAPGCSPEILGGYYVRDGKVYWSGGIDSGSHEVVGADAASFHPLADNYARDRSHVYYHTDMLADADANGFKTLGGGYALDGSHAYYDGKEVAVTDVSAFELLDPTSAGLAKDSAAVFCQGQVLSRDPTHFQVVRFSGTNKNPDYTKDGRTVYYKCRPIPGADPATFRRLNDSYWNYAVDNQRVYYQDRVIAGADPRTFHVLYDVANESCAADQQHAYRWDSVIPGVEPRSFPPGKAVTGCDDTSVSFTP